MAGAGKSTQCKRLSDEKGYQWLAVGDVLRACETGTDRAVMMSGKVLDDTIVTPIVEEELRRLGDEPEILLDGCPRTLGQAQWLASKVDPKTHAVVHLVINDDEALRRLMLRGREDDNQEAMRQRFAGYHRDIAPVLGAFMAQSVPIFEIDANGDQGGVYNQIIERLSQL